MKKFILDVLRTTLKVTCAAIVVCGLVIGGAALANYSATQGSGTSFGSIVIGGVHFMSMLFCDATTANQCASVSATGAVKVDASAAGAGSVTQATSPWIVDETNSGQLHTDLTTINTSINNPTTMFSALALSSVTRPANTTTYTANTGWCTLTSSCVTTFTFSNVCRANGAEILIPQIDIWSSANPTTKLQGVLWLFDATVGTIISDDATFNIAAADFANLTGNQQGFPFTLASAQASGAANSGVSLTGTTYHAQCESGAQTILGMVQVVNAYVPASGEVLHVALHSVGVN